MSDWQTIDSAPKDGTRILAVDKDDTMIVTLWGKVSHIPIYGWLDLDVPFDPNDVDLFTPTHWQPLPATPAKEQAA